MLSKADKIKSSASVKQESLFVQMLEDKKAILEELSGKKTKGNSALVNIINPLK